MAAPGFLGHTEFLSDYFGRPVLMLMHGKSLSVIPITVHVPLMEVSGALKRKMNDPDFLANLKILARWKELEGRWALCGMNPHAGEDGLLGREELDFMRERADHWRREGLPLDGPLASDGIFQQFHENRYRLVLAAYHDQGLIPFKALEGKQGVNCTVGLPFVRTSPDHGTAFDLAGRGLADPSSFLAAFGLVQSGGRLWT
jgi:4-hydroxythreonine-4-phosphate dehydrogenase